MSPHAKDNGRRNLFHHYTLAELERFATSQYRRVVVPTVTPDDCWLLEECLRQLKKKMQLSAAERRGFLARRLGFDREVLHRAKTIRDRHGSFKGLSGMTAPKAASRRRGPKVETGSNGQAGHGAQQPEAKSPSGQTHEDKIVLPHDLGASLAGHPPGLDSPRATGGSPMSRSRLVPREAITIRRYPEIEAVVERFFTGDDPRALMILGRPGIGKDEIFQKYARSIPDWPSIRRSRG